MATPKKEMSTKGKVFLGTVMIAGAIFIAYLLVGTGMVVLTKQMFGVTYASWTIPAGASAVQIAACLGLGTLLTGGLVGLFNEGKMLLNSVD